MQLNKPIAVTILLGLAACGKEGQNWYGAFGYDGKTVEYETWYHDPGLERVTGNNGISYRVLVDGKTASMAGNYIPDTWSEAAECDDLGTEFWEGVADKFKAVNPGKSHREEHTWIYNNLAAMRDVPRTLPSDYFDQKALTQRAEDPVWAAELKASQEAGQRMMADYRRDHPNEFDANGDELRSSLGKGGRTKNRGFHGQIREAGYEFHQRLELWAEHFYITGYDHSGTWAYTYKRRQGSQDPWALVSVDGYKSCNHGACPATEKMQRREVCDSNVVSDWYVLDGECKGNWMTGHLCNDDTSIQINHAQGIWTGWECPGHNRGIVPRCGRQF